jgi:hypothetical protein
MENIDYFAELYVAGLFAVAGWNIYFPHRDKGFDFIISKDIYLVGQIIRPVQVKGKYPTEGKTNKAVYGYVGQLTARHPDMVLAIPFFPYENPQKPSCVAFLPNYKIKPHAKGVHCEPARFCEGMPIPRKEFLRFFNEEGLSKLDSLKWSQKP